MFVFPRLRRKYFCRFQQWLFGRNGLCMGCGGTSICKRYILRIAAVHPCAGARVDSEAELRAGPPAITAGWEARGALLLRAPSLA
jgi:hypothetical protein